MESGSSSRKIVEVFIETDSESESSNSSNGRAGDDPNEPISDPVEELESEDEEPPAEEMSVMEDSEHEEPVVFFDDAEVEIDQEIYPDPGESEPLSPVEADINFQETLDDPLDIVHLEESMGAEYQLSEPAPIPIADELSPPDPPSSESSKITEDPTPLLDEESPLPEPKPIDPSKEYCLCRQPADSYSMIYCHKCLEWFHGECVGITRQKAASVRKFYCPLCIDKNPYLVSVFESRAEGARSAGGDQGGRGKGAPEKKPKNKKHSRRCGECVACLTDVDCQKCRFCRDMTKYGGRGSLRQKCIKRQCLRYSRILYAEDPIYNRQATMQEDIAAELRAVGGSLASPPQSELLVDSKPKCESPTGGQLGDEDYELPAPKKRVAAKKGKPPSKGGGVKGGAKGKKSRSMKARTKTRLSTSDFDFDELDVTRTRKRSRQPFSDILSGSGYFRDDPPQQCLGPECVFAARPHSKYCSEECGVQLALRRIRKYLPRRRQLCGEAEPRATQRNRENLERLEKEQKDIKKRLEELDRQTVAIDDHVQRLSTVTPISDDETDVDSDDLTIHCATCSQPVTLKKAMAHFERCFNRLEGMVSFGSIVKNEGTNIFCDKYDSSQKTYCKRLRVLCPEHTKEPKIGPKEVCGCPLEALFPSQLVQSTNYCRLHKKSCGTHYCWEKLRKAEIDQEKLNLFLKLEELGEQSRLNQWQIDSRSSMLAIMLHHTIDHERDHSADISTLTDPSPS